MWEGHNLTHNTLSVLWSSKFIPFSYVKYIYPTPAARKFLTHSSINSKSKFSSKSHLNQVSGNDTSWGKIPLYLKPAKPKSYFKLLKHSNGTGIGQTQCPGHSQVFSLESVNPGICFHVRGFLMGPCLCFVYYQTSLRKSRFIHLFPTGQIRGQILPNVLIT